MIIDHLKSAAETVKAVVRLHQRGVVDLLRPDQLRAMSADGAKFGPQATFAMHAAQRAPNAPALVDERGGMTYREMDDQSNALARALLDRDLETGAVIGVLARDHRGLLLTMTAAGKAGLRLVLLNTGSAKPQLAEVVEREHVRVLLHDSEFADLVSLVPESVSRILTWVDGTETATATVDEVVASYSTARLPRPVRYGGLVILTSGTTGLPKGAARTKISPMISAQLVDRIPYPRNGTMVVVSPIFHGTGMANLLVAQALLCKAVVMRRFDPEATLAALAEHKAQMLVAIPTMLNRILALGPETIARYDLSSLEVILVAGSALSPDLARRTQDTFGEVLYNAYGSTEVAIGSIATPAELRKAPGTVGRPPVTMRVALFDDDGIRITTPNTRGRIFVRSATPFEGYTDGRTKQVIDGFMSTGDMGRIDQDGLLFVDGRDDDMIVSGGENVYPLEVENMLLQHADVFDVAVIGVDDADFGKRLRAFIVAGPDAPHDVAAIKAYVKERLARYKVPRDVIYLDELPRNPTGKVLRSALQNYVLDEVSTQVKADKGFSE